MARKRMIKTDFWEDEFVQELSVDGKLLFLYFLTNPHTSICGVYKISITTISFETGISKDRVLKSIDSLSKANKVYYIDGYVVIKNFTKHQQSNEKVKKGVEYALSELPLELKQKLLKDDRLCIDYDRLCIEYDISEYKSESEFQSQSQSQLKSKDHVEETPSQKMKDFIKSVKEKDEVFLSLSEKLSTEKSLDVEMVRGELTKFVNYWTELNKSGTKQRWELEKVFEVQRRLATWFGNVKGGFSPKPTRGVSFIS